ncbi:c-type cytochrome [Limisalsivibrio acetivorans]|uniref:c-type cytochrome n=1 Tax=Limisalsivibrio acetivorans TaxID=1304888 RepID=UPI0003B3F708|nr:cytochrome c [Limisalsivibrio acetivorans]
MRLLAVIFMFAFVITAFAASNGEETFYKKCSSCHGTSLSLSKDYSKGRWKSVIKRMKGHGLDISRSETDSVAEFLSER